MSTLGTLGGFWKTFDGGYNETWSHAQYNCMFSKNYDTLKFEICVPKLSIVF